jgi:hypothetical protein
MDAPFIIGLCWLVAALISAALVMVGTNLLLRPMRNPPAADP